MDVGQSEHTSSKPNGKRARKRASTAKTKETESSKPELSKPPATSRATEDDDAGDHLDDPRHRLAAIRAASTEVDQAKARKKIASKDLEAKEARLSELIHHDVVTDLRQLALPIGAPKDATSKLESPAVPPPPTTIALDEHGKERIVTASKASDLRKVIAAGFPHQFVSGFGDAPTDRNVRLFGIRGEPVYGVDGEGKMHALAPEQASALFDSLTHYRCITLRVGRKNRIFCGFHGGRRFFAGVTYNEHGVVVGLDDHDPPREVDVKDQCVQALLSGNDVMLEDGTHIVALKNVKMPTTKRARPSTKPTAGSKKRRGPRRTATK